MLAADIHRNSKPTDLDRPATIPMDLPAIDSSHSPLHIHPQPFTPTSYSHYGTCITAPFPRTIQSYTPPTSLPTPNPCYPTQPTPGPANQATALKTPLISPLTNNYHASTSPSTTKPQISLFSTFPRPPIQPILITHLERHPYTSQTFTPLALATSSSTYYLVVSAPTLHNETIAGVQNPPDVSRIEAFVARGDQAVTYAPGTWHAPMIVVGRQRVDFVVVQFGNGVPGDDCELVRVGAGVWVDTSSVGGSEDDRGSGRKGRAKL